MDIKKKNPKWHKISCIVLALLWWALGFLYLIQAFPKYKWDKVLVPEKTLFFSFHDIYHNILKIQEKLKYAAIKQFLTAFCSSFKYL